MKSKIARCFLLIIGICFYACQTPKNNENSSAGRPNIVFIMTDDHSFQTLSAYDNRFIETPNMDRIARDGILFANSFVSNSICGPSRAAMLTGKLSHKNGFMINGGKPFDGSQPTFPKYLQQAGYQTALIGKWHLKSIPTGFDHWEILPGQGSYYNPDFIENGDTVQTEGYVTTIITDKGLQWLGKRDKSKPFCLLLHHKAAHRVWQPDTSLLNTFQNKKFEVPDNYFDTYTGRKAAAAQKMSIIKDMDLVYDLKMLDKEGEFQTKYRKSFENIYKHMNAEQRAAWDAYYEPVIAKFKAADLSGEELALWKYQRFMEDYVKTVKSIDDNIGRVLDYLDEQGLTDNTLVVYTSDQGFYMGEHGWFDKRFMYEESMRTPLLMRFPKGIHTVSKVDGLVQNIDYAPTILDLAGIDIPSDIQGESLMPLVKGEKKKVRDALYYHYYEFPNDHRVKRHYGIRTDRYKLIHFYNDIDEWELYDLAEDPDEMNNLYGKQAYQPVVDALKAKLAKLQHTYDDTDLSTY